MQTVTLIPTCGRKSRVERLCVNLTEISDIRALYFFVEVKGRRIRRHFVRSTVGRWEPTACFKPLRRNRRPVKRILFRLDLNGSARLNLNPALNNAF